MAGTDLHEVLVALDGSPFAERAVPTGRWLADRLQVPVRLLHVASSERADAHVERRLAAICSDGDADAWSVVSDPHPADIIAAQIGYGDGVLGCLATHGRDRSGALLGSVAHRVVTDVQVPVVLVGPNATAAARGSVIVAVEGSADDIDVARVGARWATTLGARLVLLTVIEPAPEPVHPGRHHQRAHGPDHPGAHLGALVAELSSPPIAVRTEIVADPVSVRDGLAAWLRDAGATLLVVGARRDRTIRRALLGDHCSQAVHDAPVPTIVVPIGLRR